jgi:hypothetical protein
VRPGSLLPLAGVASPLFGPPTNGLGLAKVAPPIRLAVPLPIFGEGNVVGAIPV